MNLNDYKKKVKGLVKEIRTGLGSSPTATTVTHDIRWDSNGYHACIFVAYHYTDVVSVTVDELMRVKCVCINNGGWPTVTTRKRINDVLQTLFQNTNHLFNIYQQNNEQRFSQLEKCTQQAQIETGSMYEGILNIPFNCFCKIHMYKNGKVKNIK